MMQPINSYTPPPHIPESIPRDLSPHDAVSRINQLHSLAEKRAALKQYYRPELTKALQHELHVQRASHELEAALKDLAWPKREEDLKEYAHSLHGLKFSEEEISFACFENEQEFKDALLKKFEEVTFHQKGIVPHWVVTKRDNPRAQASMLKAQTDSFPVVGFIRGNPDLPDYPFPHGYHSSKLASSGFQGEEYLSNPRLQQIAEVLTTKGTHGDFRYVAGLQKGGLSGIMDIFVDGAIYTPWVGTISLNIGRDESQGRHGPWYAVMKEAFDPMDKPFSTSLEIPLQQIECLLVPHVEDKRYLLNALSNAVTFKLLTPEKKGEIEQKVKTYEEAIQELYHPHQR